MSNIINDDPAFYPKSAGPIAARNLTKAVENYRGQIAAIDRELDAAEQAFADAFAREDVVQSARDRLADMANKASRAKRDLNLR